MNKSLFFSLFLFTVSTISALHNLNEADEAILKTQQDYFKGINDRILRMNDQIKTIPVEVAAEIITGIKSQITNERINAAILLNNYGCSIDLARKEAFEDAQKANTEGPFLALFYYYSSNGLPSTEALAIIKNEGERLNQEQVIKPLIAMIEAHLAARVQELANTHLPGQK